MGSSQITRKRAGVGSQGSQWDGLEAQGAMVRGGPTSQRGAELPAWLSPGDKKGPHSKDSHWDSPGAKTGAVEPPAPGQEGKRGQERLCQVKHRRRQSGRRGPCQLAPSVGWGRNLGALGRVLHGPRGHVPR